MQYPEDRTSWNGGLKLMSKTIQPIHPIKTQSCYSASTAYISAKMVTSE